MEKTMLNRNFTYVISYHSHLESLENLKGLDFQSINLSNNIAIEIFE